MMSISRVANFRSSIDVTSILKLCNASQNSLRNLTSYSALKYLKTDAFSPPQFVKETLYSHKTFLPLSKSSSLSFNRTHSLFLHTQPRQRSYGAFQFRVNGKPHTCFVHFFHTQRTCTAKSGSGMRRSPNQKNQSGLIYIVAVFVLMLGGAYAGVPLYKVFCQATGLGGQAVKQEQDAEKIEAMQKVDRQIRVRFNADVASSMRWSFKPQQSEVTVSPGETALAFYTAKNPTDKPIIGISTYNVLPLDAGQYFNKIQCFCFEEQRLNPKEQVDMPVFFYIDPEFAEDPKLEHVQTITLSYTFFEATEGLSLPLPGYPQPDDPIPATAS